MQVSVENLGSIGRRLTVAVPAEQVEKEVVDRLKKLAKNVRLPGFRPGKAPLKVIENRYGGDVLNEVASSLIESSLRDALTQEKLVPAGGPDVEPKKLGRGEVLEYVASFDVFPEIEKLDISGVELERPVYELDESDVDATLETMRKQRLSWDPVERVAEEKDQVVVDFVGSIDGEPFEGNTAENFGVVLGESGLLPEFEKALLGGKKGDEVNADVHFPEDYHGKEVAGKTATFDIRIQAVNQAVLPEIDTEFAEQFGVEGGDLGKLRQEVGANVQREMGDRVRRLLRERVLNSLLEANDIDLPKKLVEAEIDHLIQSNKDMLEGQGLPVKNISPDRERFRSDAEKRVTLGLIMQAIIQASELKPDADRVRSRITDMAAGYDEPEAFTQWYYSDRQRLAQLESVILEEQVIDHLLESATVVDKKMTFDELMEGNPAGE